MSRRRGSSRLPLLDPEGSLDDASLSPARDALQGQLDAALTLKKKSWFGSLRDTVSKTALQAKAAVDTLRGEQSKDDK